MQLGLGGAFSLRRRFLPCTANDGVTCCAFLGAVHTSSGILLEYATKEGTERKQLAFIEEMSGYAVCLTVIERWHNYQCRLKKKHGRGEATFNC